MLAYLLEGQGTPLMLIHGFPFDKRLWQPLIPYLHTDCRLIIPDLPGFGQSPLPDQPLSMENMADALASLLDDLQIDKVVLAGHSMGGYIAFAFARRHFDRLFGLGLIATHPAADAPPKRAQRAQQAAEISLHGLDKLSREMPPLLTADPAWQNFIAELIRDQKADAVAAALKAMAIRQAAFDLLDDLAALPVALISGEQDNLIPPELYQRMRRHLPQAVEARFPKTGHMPMLTHPQESAQALKAICPSK